jgi:hypothetical protein
VGYNAAWFFDKHHMTFYKEGGLSWLSPMTAPPLIPSFVKYSRMLNKNTELGLSTFSYAKSYNFALSSITEQKWDIWIRSVNAVTISVGRSFILNLNRFAELKYTFSPGISYRWGTELVYMGENDYHDVIAICTCDYKSIGLGSTGSMDIVLRNRLYLGGSVGYTYYFEKSRMNPNSTYYIKAYKPNRDVLVFHPRLGVLF